MTLTLKNKYTLNRHFLIGQWFMPITFISLVLCLACTNPKEKLSAATSSLALLQLNEKEDTLAFSDRVRKYVAKNAPLGYLPNPICDTFYKIPISKFNPSKYLNLFKTESGVATCGLAAQIMVKILIQNGIDAYTYNFGFEGTGYTHVVVLVKNNGRYFIYDPFINYTLLDVAGNNMDIERLLLQIAGDSVQVKFSVDTAMTNFVIDEQSLPKTIRELLPSKNCEEFGIRATQVRKSIYKTSMSRCFACESDGRCFRFVPAFETHLIANSKFNSFHEGIALKINGVSGAPDYENVNAIVDSLIAELPSLKRSGL